MKRLEFNEPEGVSNYEKWKEYEKKIKRAISQTKYYLKTKGKGSLESKQYLKELLKEKAKVDKKITLKITKETLRSFEKSGILSKQMREHAEKLTMKKRVKYVKSKYKATQFSVYQSRLEESMIASKATGVPVKLPKRAKTLEEIYVGGVMKGSGDSGYVKGQKALQLQLKRYGRAGLSNFRQEIYIQNFEKALRSRGYNMNDDKIVKLFQEMKKMNPKELSIAVKNGLIPDIVDVYISEDFVQGGSTTKPLGEKIDFFISQKKEIAKQAEEVWKASTIDTYKKHLKKVYK